jgi:hypothetical protein
LFDDGGGLIRGVIVDDEDIEIFFQVLNCQDQFANIIGFLVGGNYDKCIGHVCLIELELLD